MSENYILDEQYELMHYGIKRKSGRYPYGSGDNPFQHEGWSKDRYLELKQSGKTDTEAAHEMGITTSQLRIELAIAREDERMEKVATAKRLRAEGKSLNQIAAEMGFKNDSSVRTLLNEKSEIRMNQARATADVLKKLCDEKGMLDVGAEVEKELGVSSREKFNQALYLLEKEGYVVWSGGVEQVTNPGKQTTQLVLCPPGTEHKEIYDFSKVHTVTEYRSKDGGDTFKPTFQYPASLDGSRVKVILADEDSGDGFKGSDKDGLVEIRRGVKDLDLGNSHYAQVRIMVDNDKYIKGMAVYRDDMPEGIDVIVNTNKSSREKGFKPIKKEDPDNPFGALIKENGGQSNYIGDDGKEHLSPINKTREEGEWSQWADRLPSQFLSKQSKSLVKQQLKMAETDKQIEYEEICALTNPTVKKVLLNKFAEDCDSAAVHLNAAALPRQKYHVILPVNTLKDNEIYAPQYKDGEKVALIRYPHGGTFEIPILTVNNKNPEGNRIISSTSIDAVGITKNVAEQLSGADFDGDTVQIIPTNEKIKINSRPQLKQLEGFDNKLEYGTTEVIDKDGKKHYINQQGKEIKPLAKTDNEMGKISNLITDMTILGANDDEIARAVKHSMVVIDAEKHKLDYRQSEKDNRIQELRDKYQGRIDPETGKYRHGAATIISKAKNEVDVVKRQGNARVNLKDKPYYDPSKPEGSLIWFEATDARYTHYKTGEEKTKTQKSTQMEETTDARTLISEAKNPIEIEYADYANKMKALANQARLEVASTGNIKRNPSATELYSAEVASLNAKLNLAQKNRPREREAQRIANAEIQSKINAWPELKDDKKTLKKMKQQAITRARRQVGSSGREVRIIFTDREWEAVQAGAISENKLSEMLKYTDIDDLREKATPRNQTSLSRAKISKAKSMQTSGYTINEIAKSLGVSPSTVSNYLNK